MTDRQVFVVTGSIIFGGILTLLLAFGLASALPGSDVRSNADESNSCPYNAAQEQCDRVERENARLAEALADCEQRGDERCDEAWNPDRARRLEREAERAARGKVRQGKVLTARIAKRAAREATDLARPRRSSGGVNVPGWACPTRWC